VLCMYNYCTMCLVSASLSVAPGPVSALMAQPGSSFIVLKWSTPQEPNGIIISYEVTYRVNDRDPVTTSIPALSTTFTIPSLTPQTTVSNISVSAYTRIGRGSVTKLGNVLRISTESGMNVLSRKSKGYVNFSFYPARSCAAGVK